ncbi:MAG: carbohydrate ABC transporter permease [Streptomycetaceae bacterium]|nr:MAG: carbohydrate ABC transporter permease [Streptomycetaceae bacterium]
MIRQDGRVQTQSKNLIVHLALLFFVLLAIGPILVIVINSFKSTEGIFSGPLKLPDSKTFSLEGFKRAVENGNFIRNYLNSTIITLGATLLTVVCSCLAAYGITEYTTKLASMIAGLFTIGIMLPVTLGTVVILKMMVKFHLLNTHLSLILVYVGICVPLGVILMVTNFRTVSSDLKEAARIDGANEFKTFLIVLPLVMPGVAAVAAITMLPIWNDLWFPLILTTGPQTQTLTLGIQQFVGVHTNDWEALIASLVLGAIPLILLFTLFSKQFIKGLSDGYSK